MDNFVIQHTTFLKILVAFSRTDLMINTFAAGVPESKHCSTLKDMTFSCLKLSKAAEVLKCSHLSLYYENLNSKC